MTMEFTEEYPNKAPVVKFKSKLFHPNVYADGSICIDILQNQWSPIYDVAAILTSIQVGSNAGLAMRLIPETNRCWLHMPAYQSKAAQLTRTSRRVPASLTEVGLCQRWPCQSCGSQDFCWP